MFLCCLFWFGLFICVGGHVCGVCVCVCAHALTHVCMHVYMNVCVGMGAWFMHV